MHAWALQRKSESKSTWSDIATQITWAFTGILKLWWEHLLEGDRTTIIENDDPLQTLFEALFHEFLGSLLIDSSHHSQLFLSQKLCDIDQLKEYYYTMQSLLYKTTDPHNVAYL